MWPAALSLVVATTSCAAVGAVAVLRDPARGNMLAALVAAVCLGASALPLVGLALVPPLGLSPQLIEAYSARLHSAMLALGVVVAPYAYFCVDEHDGGDDGGDDYNDVRGRRACTARMGRALRSTLVLLLGPTLLLLAGLALRGNSVASSGAGEWSNVTAVEAAVEIAVEAAGERLLASGPGGARARAALLADARGVALNALGVCALGTWVIYATYGLLLLPPRLCAPFAALAGAHADGDADGRRGADGADDDGYAPEYDDEYALPSRESHRVQERRLHAMLRYSSASKSRGRGGAGRRRDDDGRRLERWHDAEVEQLRRRRPPPRPPPRGPPSACAAAGARALAALGAALGVLGACAGLLVGTALGGAALGSAWSPLDDLLLALAARRPHHVAGAHPDPAGPTPDALVLCVLVLYAHAAALFGLASLGVRACTLLLFSLRPRRTAPKALIVCASIALLLAVGLELIVPLLLPAYLAAPCDAPPMLAPRRCRQSQLAWLSSTLFATELGPPPRLVPYLRAAFFAAAATWGVSAALKRRRRLRRDRRGARSEGFADEDAMDEEEEHGLLDGEDGDL